MPNSPAPRRIDILAYANAQLLDVTGPAQVFATANDLRPRGSPPPYEIAIVADEGAGTGAGAVVTSSRVTLHAAPLPDADAPLHTLVVAGGWGIRDACTRPALVEWVRRRAGVAARTASVCSGAFLLAEAGLLDGRRAVTHWQRTAEFTARYPAVRLDPDPIFIRDGTVWTSAGITAGIDLALALVEEDLGRAHALAVARHLVVFLKRPGGQAQFSTALALQTADERFERLHAWITENIGRDLSLAVLAEQAGMSLRSFSRRYRAATGHTPARAVETLRVEAARRLIEDGVPITRAWHRCGFGSEETMRRTFVRTLGVSPQAYRERFSR
ncbi:transcriptional regulator GlxA family with amidase domain [Azospirillum fermentarium]|uniref:GlxA family transcriptional regulator n=1 Tax=Azospirillum fermentarium TaxID=1233114 RepID=UPI002225D983|nr:GlxA family transcriptional regulator [Azospirillum fermentarium]MCW2244637.1 transcriptional regulator GlxA family with amidase domain [Azospirillum fermentarium]